MNGLKESDELERTITLIYEEGVTGKQENIYLFDDLHVHLPFTKNHVKT